MAIKDRLVALNALRKLAGKSPLKAWKQSKDELEAQISALKASVKVGNMDEAQYEAPEIPEKKPRPIAEPVKTEAVKPVKTEAKTSTDDTSRNRSTGIGAAIKELIYQGLDNKTIFEKLMKDRPTLLCTEVDGEMKPTKKWYIAWYRGDLHRKGKLNAE